MTLFLVVTHHLRTTDISKYKNNNFPPSNFCERASVREREGVTILSVLRGPNVSCQIFSISHSVYIQCKDIMYLHLILYRVLQFIPNQATASFFNRNSVVFFTVIIKQCIIIILLVNSYISYAFYLLKLIYTVVFFKIP